MNTEANSRKWSWIQVNERPCTRTGMLLLLLLTLPIAVQAQFNYTTTNGTITITGYTGPGGDVTIPDTITGLPVTSIGDSAFSGCTSLTSVTIPDNVMTIGMWAFSECTNVTNFDIGNSVTGIGYGAFEYCTSLTRVTIPDNVMTIGMWAFSECTNVTNVSIGNSVTSIGDGAFSGCSRLTSIDVDPQNPAYSSHDGVLFNKSQTTLIQCPGGKAGTYTVPNTVITIGYWAFEYCTSLTSVTIANSVLDIGYYAFSGCTSLTSVTIGQGVTNINDFKFTGCTSLATITVDAANSVYSSAEGVLFNKDQTTLIRCPEGKAGSYTIPNSVTSIVHLAFLACSSLTAIDVDPQNSAYSSLEGVLFNKDQTTLIQCPESKIGSYTIPDSVISIGQWAFIGCTRLTSVTIPDSVLDIAYGAFECCTSLASVTIGQGVTSIGQVAFRACTSLTSVTIPNSVTNWEDGGKSASTFDGCTNLVSVTIGDGVKRIPISAFANCTSLTSVTIGSGVTVIEGNAFNGCTSLATFTVDAANSVYSSAEGVLFNKDQTTLIRCPEGKAGSYTIPDSVLDIAGGAFIDCTRLASVTIPNRVTYIGDGAFSVCTNLTGVYFEGNAPSLGTYVLDGANNARVYYLPGTIGWGPTYADRPTAPWLLPYPVILTIGPSFGLQTNRFGFIISWATNVPVVVEASTTLANPTWSPISTITLTNGSAYFSDPQWTNYPARFYRLRSP
jgi:hypothetical protein